MTLPLTSVRANYSCIFSSFFFCFPCSQYKGKKEGNEVIATRKCVQGKTYYSGVTTFCLFVFFLPHWENGTRGHQFCLLTFLLSVIFAVATSPFSLRSHNKVTKSVCVFGWRGMCAVGISRCCKSGSVIDFSSHCFIVLFVVLRLLSCFSSFFFSPHEY